MEIVSSPERQSGSEFELERIFRFKTGDAEAPSLFSNSWSGFMGYLFHRNRGFFQRKVLNLASEVVELACLSLAFDLGLLKSLLLVPLVHILINQLAEFHWQLSRTLPGAWRERRVNPLDLGLWVLSAFFLVILGFWMGSKDDTRGILSTLVAIRALAVVVQLLFAPAVARLTTLRRVRPNLTLLRAGTVGTWALCIAAAYFFSG
ncbi:MAG: hypothetical protein KGP28_02405, partial [Bdellovibrionales bacterium]|nr:hypothetical protein [Bdellovibrionales bacterium]